MSQREERSDGHHHRSSITDSEHPTSRLQSAEDRITHSSELLEVWEEVSKTLHPLNVIVISNSLLISVISSCTFLGGEGGGGGGGGGMWRRAEQEEE